jgi:ribosome-interacting GTPase 1
MLHVRLTASGAHVASYPFTTQYPEPGMMPHEDIHFQLIDLPAVSREHPVPWIAGSLQIADAALLVVDLGDPACVEQMEGVRAVLQEHRVTLTERWDGGNADGAGADDPFALRLPTLVLANKVDRVADPDAELSIFRELTGVAYPMLAVSAVTGHGLGEIGPWLFRRLGIVRAYTSYGRSRYAAVKRSGTLRGSCTRISSARSGTRACGAKPASMVNRSAPTMRSPTATWSSCTQADHSAALRNAASTPGGTALSPGQP